jgi:ribonuclease VapC
LIVDTSALIAVRRGEDGARVIATALADEPALIPAPVVTEYHLVTSGMSNRADSDAQALLADLLAHQAGIEPFAEEDAKLTPEAHRLYGRGNGRGGTLNMLDIMVYCMAKRLDRPILCTGRDFASTDARIHPGSRGW